MNINLKGLIGKLDDTSRRALEGAAGLCLSRTHYDVDIEHFLTKLMEMPDTDLHRIFRYYGIDHSRVSRDLTRVLDGLKTGNARTPTLSPRLPRLINEAWSLASVEYDANRVRSGHLLLALLNEPDFARMMRDVSEEIQKISLEDFHAKFRDVVAESIEGLEQFSTGAGEMPTQEGAAPHGSKTPALDQFTIDLTAKAKEGKVDPVLGRDAEIRQVIDILTRRRQNNPILTGEAGVGKTAVVEGLALRIVAGDVPPPLKHVTIRVLDLALLQAGAGVKGEFENRLKSVINEVKASPTPIITFIDEAHTLIGAGGQAGQGDAANLLKPALARGELRTIAATTWAEYKKYFEKDPALTRRFQVVKVEEPTEATAINMMRGLAATMEEHHKVRVLDEAVEAAVKLSHRYISGRQLPDKAVSVLDTACARVALGLVADPPAIEDARRRISLIYTEIGILERETVTGGQHQERLNELAQEKTTEENELAALQKQWEQEKQLVTQIASIRSQLEGQVQPPKTEAKANGKAEKTSNGTAAPPQRLSPDEVTKLQTNLARLNTELSTLQGENPLLQPCVDGQAIAQVISAWTGIPIGRMVKDEINTVLNLKDHLEKRVIGQNHALDALSQRLRTARAKLEDPRKPIGVFMFVGPSGVGKTETALALAELLFGSDHNLTTINMSEYKEEHKVSLLMGSPPGYVGYGEGGVLTEAVRRKPYSVVLLDEMEKAHIGVQDIFYQVFDKGSMKDGEGRDIDFKNTVIIMTSNAGTDTFMKLCADPDTKPDPEGLADAIRGDLLKFFKPAFLGRTIVVPYYPIAPEIMRRIIELQIGRIRNRIRENHRAALSYDEALIDTIAKRCTEVDSGARNVDHILTRTLLPELSKEFLARMATGQPVSKVHIAVTPQGSFAYDVG
ncbi:MAG: type VI secretion system ATPase TssH [Nitrospira sp.]|nr:type VI secretion system ATPase TssH [Nitrospira sp.]MDH4243239.1 type VI secretion system ATPase TssH [Nitrospira sp.]MDH4356012.1 type VI secretion system ATPase TssH [Nitrospira sp.]MDH5317415.1 type VI secretion system ATPase TssH [Nitrospira sp.]